MKDRRIYIYIICTFILVNLLAFVINRLMWVNMLKPALESLIAMAVLLFIFSNDRLRRFAFQLPRSYKILVVTLFFLAASAQYINKGRATFPIIAWRMFDSANKENKANFFKYVGVDQNGKKHNIYPPRLFPSMQQGRFVSGLERDMHAAIKENDKQRSISSDEGEGIKAALKRSIHAIRVALREAKDYDQKESRRRLEETFTAIGQRYNRLNPNEKIEVIEIYKGEVNFSLPAEQVLRYEFLWRLQLEEGAYFETHS